MKAASFAAALVLVWSGAAMAQAGDAAKGEQVFKKCQTCHQVGPTAKNGVGPVLNGVVGRKAGTIAGYSYSAVNKAAGESGLEWTEQAIFEYLPDPNAFLKKFIESKGGKAPAGATKMAFKLPSEAERRDVIAFLKTKQ